MAALLVVFVVADHVAAALVVADDRKNDSSMRERFAAAYMYIGELQKLDEVGYREKFYLDDYDDM